MGWGSWGLTGIHGDLCGCSGITSNDPIVASLRWSLVGSHHVGGVTVGIDVYIPKFAFSWVGELLWFIQMLWILLISGLSHGMAHAYDHHSFSAALLDGTKHAYSPAWQSKIDRGFSYPLGEWCISHLWLVGVGWHCRLMFAGSIPLAWCVLFGWCQLKCTSNIFEPLVDAFVICIPTKDDYSW